MVPFRSTAKPAGEWVEGWKREVVATLTKPLFLAAVVLGLALLVGPTLLDGTPDLRSAFDRAPSGSRGDGQSASQLSEGEFAQIGNGFTTTRLRALAGEPASSSADEVEGVRLECWYYGIVGGTGAYQFCFADGKLRAKLRYDR
jgi:hypothetical protein